MSSIRDLYSEEYFRSYCGKGYDKVVTERNFRRVVEFIALKKGRIRLLDIGCAYGFLIKAASEVGLDAYGIDISIYALRQVPELSSKLILASGTNLPFRSESFDAVTLFEVIEHVSDGERVLKEVHRILKPKGLGVLTTPIPSKEKGEDPTHINVRPPDFWISLLKKLGFKTYPYYDPRYYHYTYINQSTFKGRITSRVFFLIDSFPSQLSEKFNEVLRRIKGRKFARSYEFKVVFEKVA
jgi:SAM-dependent methyltransferase